MPHEWCWIKRGRIEEVKVVAIKEKKENKYRKWMKWDGNDEMKKSKSEERK